MYEQSSNIGGGTGTVRWIVPGYFLLVLDWFLLELHLPLLGMLSKNHEVEICDRMVCPRLAPRLTY